MTDPQDTPPGGIPIRPRPPRAFVVALLVLGFASSAAAQDPLPLPSVELPAVGETLALDANGRAPWAGMLVRDDDLFALQSAVMTSRLALDNTHRLYLEALAGRAALLEAAERTCLERVALHDSLWRERRDEIARAYEKERGRGISWYEHPALWFTIGGLVVGAIVLGIASALGG